MIFLVILFFIVGAIAGSGVLKTQKERESSSEDNSTFSQVVLEVPTISCQSCKSRVEASARGVGGVKVVKFDGQTVTIAYDPELATPDAIVVAIEAGGDRVTKVTKL